MVEVGIPRGGKTYKKAFLTSSVLVIQHWCSLTSRILNFFFLSKEGESSFLGMPPPNPQHVPIFGNLFSLANTRQAKLHFIVSLPTIFSTQGTLSGGSK